MSDETISHVESLLASGQLSTGEIVAEFESRFSSYVNRSYGVAVSSGSVALELVLEELFEEGDRIAISPYNCGAVLYSILREDLIPVFVDIEYETGAIDPHELFSLGASVDGVIVTHIFGQPAKMDRIRTAADELGATVVEDFAQAPGAEWRGEPAGSFGRVSVCSFGATKNITTAEGGMVVTDDETLYREIESRRSNTSDEVPPPRSVRMNDLEAAIGLGSLRKYDDVVAQKRTVADVYYGEIEAGTLPTVGEAATHVYHAFPVRHPEANALARHLEDHEVQTSRLYTQLLHEYDACPAVEGRFDRSRTLADEVVLLPIHADVDVTQARTVASIVNDF